VTVRRHHHHGDHDHGHSHGLVDRSIVRSRDGVRAVALSLAVLLLTALAQTAIFAAATSGMASDQASSASRVVPYASSSR
jgi:hypothetical protein